VGGSLSGFDWRGRRLETARAQASPADAADPVVGRQIDTPSFDRPLQHALHPYIHTALLPAPWLERAHRAGCRGITERAPSFLHLAANGPWQSALAACSSRHAPEKSAL
jgi:hypothetical protein